MKRVFAVTLGVFVFFTILFLIVKIWGGAQKYAEYKHPMLLNNTEPIVFVKPSLDQFLNIVSQNEFLYLDVGTTADGKVVFPLQSIDPKRPLRHSKLSDIESLVVTLEQLSKELKNKKIIFNIMENAVGVHETLDLEFKKFELADGKNFIFTCAYDAPIKALKERIPFWVYGSTKPEILKIMAMRSMYLLEALSLRADVVIHPLKIRGYDFFDLDLNSELQKRHKKIIIGPVSSEELELARKLNPMGIILNNKD